MIEERKIYFMEGYSQCRVSQKGIALIMVLWVMTILMVTVMSFSYMTRTETHAAHVFKKGIEKKFLSEAGIERGIIEVLYRIKNPPAEVSSVWNTDGTPYRVEMDNGYCKISVTDESGKVDINRTSEVILKNMLGNFNFKPEEADTIVDSIMDWRDADDLHRLHGAENDYYMSLPKPYKARNSKFETLEELIMVKGVTPEILYGDEKKRGLIDFLTIHSATGKINLNTAPKEVLLAIPGMSYELSDAITTLRSINQTQNIQGALGQSYTVIAPYVYSGGIGNAFSIEAVCYTGSDKAGYAIRATVKIDSNYQYKYLYYKSPVHAKYASNDSP